MHNTYRHTHTHARLLLSSVRSVVLLSCFWLIRCFRMFSPSVIFGVCSLFSLIATSKLLFDTIKSIDKGTEFNSNSSSYNNNKYNKFEIKKHAERSSSVILLLLVLLVVSMLSRTILDTRGIRKL